MSTRVATSVDALKKEAELADQESKKLCKTARQSKISTQKRRNKEDSSVKVDNMPVEWADEGDE